MKLNQTTPSKKGKPRYTCNFMDLIGVLEDGEELSGGYDAIYRRILAKVKPIGGRKHFRKDSKGSRTKEIVFIGTEKWTLNKIEKLCTQQ